MSNTRPSPEDFSQPHILRVRHARNVRFVLMFDAIGMHQMMWREQKTGTTASFRSDADPKGIPVAEGRVVVSGSNEFNWKEYYCRTLAALENDKHEVFTGK